MGSNVSVISRVGHGAVNITCQKPHISLPLYCTVLTRQLALRYCLAVLFLSNVLIFSCSCMPNWISVDKELYEL